MKYALPALGFFLIIAGAGMMAGDDVSQTGFILAAVGLILILIGAIRANRNRPA